MELKFESCVKLLALNTRVEVLRDLYCNCRVWSLMYRSLVQLAHVSKLHDLYCFLEIPRSPNIFMICSLDIRRFIEDS